MGVKGWPERFKLLSFFGRGRGGGSVGAAVDGSWILGISFNLDLRDADS